MEIKIYQIDAFTEHIFSGNPAAVCPLDNWISDDLMQKIAMENNLAETAFYVRTGDVFQIRWFTPEVEVDLCGHATLAAAFVLFNYEGYNLESINFYSERSGALLVKRSGELLTLNFPTDILEQVPMNEQICAAFNHVSLEVYKGKTDYLFVFETQAQINEIEVDLKAIAALDGRGVIITAPGEDVDFVSRFFAPQSGIDEDPVTGSAHTSLTPFWSKKLDKKELTALQLSKRQGKLWCKDLDDRVEISGYAKLYLSGTIFID